MAGVEIANAYISLTTKAGGIKSQVEKELGGVDASASGRRVGSSFMGGVKVAALAGAAAVAAAGVAAVGVALSKGFSRLNAIDQATAKMEGLGFTAEETTGLMNNALESVRGTAFGLGDAAGVAAKLAAGGLGPGEEMADLLSTVANSAAAAGGSLDEMGSIFAKAMTQANGVQNDVIGQLADRGIPIYQALAEQLGVTAGEVFKLASAGEVSFEQFAAAAESAAGGVAAAMGGTVQGSWDNLMASLGRSGANFLEPVFAQLAPTLQAITEAMGPLEGVAGELGEKFGSVVVPVLESFVDLLNSGFDFSAFGELLGYLSPLGVAFQVLQPVLPQIVSMLGQVASVLGEALGSVIQAVLPVVTSLVTVMAQFLAEVLPPILPLITLLAQTIGQLLVAVLPLLEPLMGLVGAILPELAEFLGLLIPIIVQVVSSIADLMIPIIDTLVAVLGGLITFLTGVFAGDWEKAWQGISDMFTGLWEGLGNIFRVVVNGWIDVLNGFLGGLNEAGNFVSDITGGAIDINIPSIPHLAEGGIVPRRAGGTLAVVGEGQYDEAVIPLSPQVLAQIGGGSGGGGPTVNVYPSEGMDETTVGTIAARKVGEAFRLAG